MPELSFAEISTFFLSRLLSLSSLFSLTPAKRYTLTRSVHRPDLTRTFEGDHLRNALRAASWDNHKKLVRMLLDERVEVNTQGSNLGNSLFIVARLGKDKLMQMLLVVGVDVNR